MTSSIAARGARGAGVTVLAQGLTMVLQFAGMVVLARLLTPDAYGLLAMVTVLMGIGALIRDFGMGTASLQESKLTQAQASNLFWMNAALTTLAAAILAFSAPLVALLFGDARLNGLVPAMAVVLLLTGLQTQYQVQLARDLRFSALAFARVSSVVVGIVVGVVMALFGWGYWALAAQQGATALWLLATVIVATRWFPSLPSRRAGSRKHIQAGANYGLANVLGYVADNVDTFMIGVRWDASILGNYNRAFQLFMQPVTAVFGPLTQVVVPTVNRAASGGGDRNNMLLRIQSALVGLASWALLITAATADWLIPLLLGQQWVSIVPLLQILAFGGVFKALSQINYWAYVIAQQSRQLLLSNLVTKPIQIILVVVASFFGVEWVAWAYVGGRALAWPINLVWLARTAQQRSWAALGNGLRITCSVGVAYVATRAVLSALPDISSLWMLSIGATVSTVLYAGVFAVSPGGVREIRALLRLRLAVRGSRQDER